MSTFAESHVDLSTTRGPMRVHLFIPDGGARHPGIIFYSEIFQATGPIRRMAAALAGEGYLVAVPEVYHEFEPLGTVLAYDAEGSARGNSLKTEKEIASYDEDTDATAKFLLDHPSCTGKIASFGVCLGGHLALRAGLHPDVRAVAAFYPTDIHTGTLGLGKCDDTLKRLPDIQTPLLFVFGRQDPHIPVEGRRLIHRELEDADVDFEWHEFNAAHAFLRDEGVRYNPALARVAMALLLRFLAEKIG
ncbi:MAG: dienelactone hydrolase family protein [Verrucomicrobiota bacterium]